MRSSPSSGPPGERAARADGALGALLALPSLLLAWPGPGAVLELDPVPHLAAVGWSALALLPAALLLVTRARRAPLALAGVLVPLAVATAVLGGVTDVLEARSAVLHLVLLAVALLGGAQLGRRGLATFAALVAACSLLLTATALARGDGGAGVLGNSGSLSQAALPGAVLAAVAVARGPLPLAVAALPAAVLFGWHAFTTPVLAGLACTGGALAVAGLRRAGGPAPAAARRQVWVPRALGAALLALFAVLVASAPPGGAGDDAPPAAGPVGGPTGGIAVRRALWRDALALVRDHPLVGVGPGQVHAAYPPYRSREEIEASTFGRRFAANVEVPHLHHDLLEGWARWGLVGGLPWTVLLVLAAWRGGRAALGGDALRAGAGAAVVAVAVNALVHAPLLTNPAAALPSFALVGALFAGGPVRPRLARAAAVAGALALVVLFPLHHALRVHGAELAERQRRVAEAPAAEGSPRDARERWLAVERALARALDAAPDSALARTLHALHLQAHPERRDDALDEWRRVLALRPHQLGALENAGLLETSTERRRALWERALALDPAHPRVLANLARLEADAGYAELALAYAARLRDRHAADGLGEPAELAALHERIARGTSEPDARRRAWRAVVELAPERTDAEHELARAELEGGRVAAAHQRLDALAARGRLDPAFVRELAATELVRGHVELGVELFERLEPGFGARGAEWHYAESRALRTGAEDAASALVADALEGLAHRTWADAHARADDPALAARSLRQALRASARHVEGGDGRTRLELAAALLAAGRADEVPRYLEGPAPDARHWRGLPDWAADALAREGLAPPGTDGGNARDRVE